MNEDARVRATLSVSGAADAQTLAYVLATPGWVRTASGGRVAVVLRAEGREPLGVGVPLWARRWGYSAVGPGTATLSACGGLLRADLPVAETRVRVLPITARYKGTQTLPYPRGVVGLHRSIRPEFLASEIATARAADGNRHPIMLNMFAHLYPLASVLPGANFWSVPLA